ncbi:MAG: hypothetical protein VX278_05730, partial [Myxococcota bacterium]|nr:hypothetical protein [Myxococcota bacterium]
NGILDVSAVEASTGAKANITVRNYGEFVNNQGGSLNIDSNSLHKERAPSDTVKDDQRSASGSAAQSSESIQKKAGFFSKLFGSKKSRDVDSDAPDTEISEEESAEESLIPVVENDRVEDEPMELDMDFLEDLDVSEDEAPASLGMADSSFAVSEREEEESLEVLEADFLLDDDEDISDLLVEGVIEEEVSPVAEEELETLAIDDILSELDDEEIEASPNTPLEQQLDALLNDLDAEKDEDATQLIERVEPETTADAFPEPSKDIEVDVEVDVLEFDSLEEHAPSEPIPEVEVTLEKVDTKPEILEEDDVEDDIELDLSFLDDSPAPDTTEQQEPVEAQATSISEESDIDVEVDLSFLDDETETEAKMETLEQVAVEELTQEAFESIVETVQEEVEQVDLNLLESASEADIDLDIDLSFLEDDEESPVSDDGESEIVIQSIEEELNVASEEQTPEEPLSEEVVSEESAADLDIDLSFLEEEPVELQQDEDIQDDSTMDVELTIPTAQPEAETVSPEPEEDEPVLTLSMQNISSESLGEEETILRDYISEQAVRPKLFDVQNDGFFVEDSSSPSIVPMEEDEPVAIPNAGDVVVEEDDDVDLDFLEDLFDD